MNHLAEAERCLEAAKTAKSPSQRALFLSMAQIWLKMADKQSAFRDRQAGIYQALRDAQKH